MQDIVIVPTYDRPEMLWHCLQYIAKCPDANKLVIWVAVDHHADQPPPPKQDIEQVTAQFPHLAVLTQWRKSHRYHGNSYNLLTAYKDAYEVEAERVFLVEDDVFVRPEFFAWHRMKHQEGFGCSIGVVKEPHHGWYASLGVGFTRETLKLIVPHCTPAYYANMRSYCRRTFPSTTEDCEQDGLWCRVLRHERVAWAYEPLCQHVGWYGYHRQKSIRPVGTLVEKYDQVKRALRSPTVLMDWSRDFNDVVPLQ